MTQPNESGAEVRCPKNWCPRHHRYYTLICRQCVEEEEDTPEPSEATEGKEATGLDALAEMAKGTSFGALFDATKEVASLQAQVEQLKRERDELRNILDAGKGQSGVSLLYDLIERRDHQIDQLRADVLRLEKERGQALKHRQIKDDLIQAQGADLAAARKELSGANTTLRALIQENSQHARRFKGIRYLAGEVAAMGGTTEKQLAREIAKLCE